MSGCGQSVTTAFIDLATFDEIEKYSYGGSEATAYFVRESRKSTWFSQVPVQLSNSSGNAEFGGEFSVNISRAGDYLLHTWLRVTLPEITLAETNSEGEHGRIRWCANFMHNLIKDCSITFNDLCAAHFDNYHLDFWTAFTVPSGKRNGYDNMIGNFPDMIEPIKEKQTIPGFTLNLPLPFWFSRDTGVALPTAALPYNEMRINFTLRNWSELLVFSNAENELKERRKAITIGSSEGSTLSVTPSLVTAQVWANYAIVSNDERKKMACAARDILIEQHQTAPKTSHTGNSPHIDIRFSHSIKALFFGIRNKTWPSEWSNYTTHSPTIAAGGTKLAFPADGALDPILETTLCYENTNRLNQMGSDYFSLVNPWYHAVSIPVDTGYHMYSYSLDFTSLDPMGSTNFGKLTNVTLVPTASEAMTKALAGSHDAGSGADFEQKFETVITAVNNNIIRISGGALGFPVL
jgi:hypothetical protein